MPNVNYKQLYAIKKNNEKRILSVCPRMKNQSGIYFYTRTDKNGISYFYIGQSVDCLERNVSHLSGYQHIDLSIKKRGFYSEENPYGWKLDFIHYPREKLDEMEQYWILEYTKKGYQCRYNKTAGGQGAGKEKINEFKPAKGYYDGIKQGKKSLAKELSHIAEKHLEIRLKPEKQGNKVSEKQYDKFMTLISESTYEESD
jgi:hypothetical protein